MSTDHAMSTIDMLGIIKACLQKIEAAIDGQPGDPGKEHPLEERVRCVIERLSCHAV
jgi:hypothetical protein